MNSARDQDSTRPLLVGLPIRLFQFYLRILGAGLRPALFVRRARDNLMFAGRGVLPIKTEESPLVLVSGRTIDVRGRPRSVVDFHFNCFERGAVAPRGTRQRNA